MADEELTPEEQAELMELTKQMYGASGVPEPDKDKSIVGFFRDIINFEKFKRVTRRAGFFDKDDEYGVRQYLDTAHYADKVGLGHVGDFLEEEAMIIADTSLSRNGFLIKAAITTKRESTTRLGEEKKKKTGWKVFGGSKDKEGVE